MPIRKSRGNKPDSNNQMLSSRSHSISSIGNDLIDKKTKQLCFFQCRMCILDRTKLSRDEEFSHIKAEVLINRQYEKRQSHCIIYCLEDCIRFEKTKTVGTKPHRNFVKYEFIKHIFIFQGKPDALMMCIDSPAKGQRTYESFKCKKPEDVKTFCELVYQAKQDEQCRLRGGNVIGRISVPSEMSLTDKHQSAIDVGRCYSNDGDESSTAALNGVDHSLFNTVEQARKQGKEPWNVDYHTAEQYNRERADEKWDLILKNDMRRMGSDWDVSITYLAWDNINGAVINDTGPVYLYVARHLRPA